jgi:ribosomal protein S18 acetylase RimI-like enzyme
MDEFELINLSDFNNPGFIEQFLNLVIIIDFESPFMLFEKGERTINSEIIQSVSIALKNADLIVFLIKSKRKFEFYGYLTGSRRKEIKLRHTLSIALGVKVEFQEKKIGSFLLREMIRTFEVDNELKRLFLTVMVNNQKAINLYKKMGFVIEGILRNSINQNNEMIDEYIMSIVK